MEMVETQSGRRNMAQYQCRMGSPNPRPTAWQASPAPIIESGSDGRMVPYYRLEMTMAKFIRAYASSSLEIEKANYVVRVCGTLNICKTTIIKTLL
jgi:hypothetical protein